MAAPPTAAVFGFAKCNDLFFCRLIGILINQSAVFGLGLRSCRHLGLILKCFRNSPYGYTIVFQLN